MDVFRNVKSEAELMKNVPVSFLVRKRKPPAEIGQGHIAKEWYGYNYSVTAALTRLAFS